MYNFSSGIPLMSVNNKSVSISIVCSTKSLSLKENNL
jgi:hypothetical protein